MIKVKQRSVEDISLTVCSYLCHLGIGKTVFTKKATFDWSQQRYSETLGAFDLVLLVRLRDVSNLQDVPSILGASEVLYSNGAISVHNLYGQTRTQSLFKCFLG